MSDNTPSRKSISFKTADGKIKVMPIETVSQWLEHYDKTLVESEKREHALQAQLDAKDTEIAAKDAQIAERDATIAELQSLKEPNT